MTPTHIRRKKLKKLEKFEGSQKSSQLTRERKSTKKHKRNVVMKWKHRGVSTGGRMVAG